MVHYAQGIMRHIYNRMEATMEFIAECLVLSSHLLVGFWTLSRDLLDGLGFGIEYRVSHTTTPHDHTTTQHAHT